MRSAGRCTRWTDGHACDDTTGVRLYIQGPLCVQHAPPPPPEPTGRLCPVCGGLFDPAGIPDWNGKPTYDRHPGCEPGGSQLRLIRGGKRA